ncbi:MAG: ABC transporter permease [Bacilli bacterium]|nr:ABC transporter permease [Bacilli bacterium]
MSENKIPTEVVEVEETTIETKETFKEMSPIRLILRRFFRSKLSLVGLIMLVLLFLFSFLGPVIYQKWGEETVDRREVIQQITSTYTYIDENGKEVKVTQILEHTATINSYANPSSEHLLGTDDNGMDVFVRLMYGGRISLLIGFIVVILETLIGVALGGISGYFGGWVDQLIMRIVDIFNCIPTLPILLIASALIDSWNLDADQRIYILMVIITIFSWSGVARMVRGQILSLREQEFIIATEVMGLPVWRKIFKHLIPNVMPQLIVSMTLGLGSVILYESTLSYLGLGVQLPKAAWGTMIATANDPQVLNYHANMWLPAGFMIVIAVLGFNFVGDGLRDAMDPKAKK